MLRKTADGSVVDGQERTIYFSVGRFVEDVCEGECCFICGAHPDTRLFNDEHIVPEWLLRAYDLFERTVNLPNGQEFRYGRYTIPCCADCNAEMGRQFEEPISRALMGGHESFARYVAEGGLSRVFVWAALIFLKTHLRDRAFRYHLDRRKGEDVIAGIYEWDYLHHLHVVARAFHTGSEIRREVAGTMVMLPADPRDAEHFDFVDLYASQCLLLRVNETALIVVFNDCGACGSVIRPIVDKIDGAVSALQQRELLARLVACPTEVVHLLC